MAFPTTVTAVPTSEGYAFFAGDPEDGHKLAVVTTKTNNGVIRGDGKSAGIVRKADLIATGKPGTLQIRLVDPATQGARDGLSAGTGDSGAPVFDCAGRVVALVSRWPYPQCGLKHHQGV